MSEEPRFNFAVADAIDSRDSATVRAIFLKHPEQSDVFTPFAGGTWLHYAARESTAEIVEVLLNLGLDPNRGDRWEGRLPLTDASRSGDVAKTKCLLDNGSRIDVSTSVRNPLFSAILGGSPEVTRLLLERAVDSRVRYDSETMKNMDAVAFAIMQGEHEIAHIIALHNAGGDEVAADTAMAEGLKIAHENTMPVPSGQDIRPS